MDQLAHVQLWTAGIGVSAGFHNHVEKSFCEIHACIVNGTGKGGMRWATVPDQDFNPAEPDLHKTKLVVVPDMSEHGPLWRTGADGYPLLRMNDTIDYPWHGMQYSLPHVSITFTDEPCSLARRTWHPEPPILRCLGCIRVPFVRNLLCRTRYQTYHSWALYHPIRRRPQVHTHVAG